MMEMDAAPLWDEPAEVVAEVVAASVAVVELARPVGRLAKAVTVERRPHQAAVLGAALERELRWLAAVEHSCCAVVVAVEVLAELERREARR